MTAASTAFSAHDHPSFALTWDYRCPFARNAHEHLIAALRGGTRFNVRFVAFSLSQTHLEEGEASVFDEPEKDSGILALQAGIVVRDTMPERFLDAHEAIFALRHDRGEDLRDEEALRRSLSAVGVDPDLVFSEISSGWPLETVRKEHESSVAEHQVFGVPTFITDRAVFVRIMTRPQGDGSVGRKAIEQVLSLMADVPELNEYKFTTIPR
jgi:predicted DsbA family dithiol-disulfide isomerase